jgi:hypothetical protein
MRRRGWRIFLRAETTGFMGITLSGEAENSKPTLQKIFRKKTPRLATGRVQQQQWTFKT